jgi:hypothetical protein
VFLAHAVQVLIASPGRTERFRAAFDQALVGWNSVNAQRCRIVLVPARERPDVVIAVFDPREPHGATAIDEVKGAHRAGVVTLAWFMADEPSDGSNASDPSWVSDVMPRLTRAGIAPRYLGHGDFLFESRLHSAITADLTDISLSTLTGRFDRAEQARRVTTYRTQVPVLGPQIWAVTVMNHGTSLATGLTVSVDTVDSNGNDLPDGANRCRQPLGDVVAKLRAGPWPARAPAFLGNGMDVLAARTLVNFPRWLRPRQHASALYAVEPDASLRVCIQFEDTAGDLWSRTDDDQPQRVSSYSASR